MEEKGEMVKLRKGVVEGGKEESRVESRMLELSF